MLSFKSNKLESLCEECLAPSVGWLILTDNRLRSLPESLGRLSGLRKLMLANNRLDRLPESLAACRELELIRLSRNNLANFPDWIFTLPKLSWLALSGNPASDTSAKIVQNSIHSSDIGIGPVIGQGASGFVHKVDTISTPLAYDTARFDGLAVKLFKGDCSSDGHPSDEVHVSGLVGSGCAHILPVLGCIAEAKPTTSMTYGLIFPQIPAHCGVLALPPSFASVSRDVYRDGTAFTLQQGLQILGGLATAGEYLHRIGVMHGDLYGHNIHVHDDGKPILVDFGAATAYGEFTDPLSWNKYQALDVRAFGCLVEEVTERIFHVSIPLELADLRDRCLSTNPAERPGFETIKTVIDRILSPLAATTP